MVSAESNNAALDPGFFDGRLLIEIETWDSTLHLGLSSDATPVEHRFQGGLNYIRGFNIEGRVIAPKAHCTKSIRIWISLFGPEMLFGRDGLDEVGQLHVVRPASGRSDLTATLLVPETAQPFAATSLSSVWKYIHIWTFDEEDDKASISAFSFSATVDANLDAWISDG